MRTRLCTVRCTVFFFNWFVQCALSIVWNWWACYLKSTELICSHKESLRGKHMHYFPHSFNGWLIFNIIISPPSAMLSFNLFQDQTSELLTFHHLFHQWKLQIPLCQRCASKVTIRFRILRTLKGLNFSTPFFWSGMMNRNKDLTECREIYDCNTKTRHWNSIVLARFGLI